MPPTSAFCCTFYLASQPLSGRRYQGNPNAFCWCSCVRELVCFLHVYFCSYVLSSAKFIFLPPPSFSTFNILVSLLLGFWLWSEGLEMIRGLPKSIVKSSHAKRTLPIVRKLMFLVWGCVSTEKTQRSVNQQELVLCCHLLSFPWCWLKLVSRGNVCVLLLTAFRICRIGRTWAI